MANVLIADDESSMRALIQATLEGPEMHTVQALNGTDALRLVREQKFDLIILDWMMPGLTGIEVLVKLRAQPETAATPVIMLTARGQLKDHDAALAAGATAYLMKPFSPLELLERIQRTLAANTQPKPGAESPQRTLSV
jgi:two-component system phosphate regulon response regulator PhoB